MKRANKPPGASITGVLVVNKPPGPTSMRVVEIVRRRAGGTKTGHAGTLDPLATGVLVLALGKATKFINQLMATDKRYRTIIDLSALTSTDDREGEREEIAVDNPPNERAVGQVVEQFVGHIEQRPPAYSAVKIDGQRAYKQARAGRTVEIPARPVVIHGIEMIWYDWPHLEIAVHCAKGVYIRSLARDIGQSLGVGGHCRSIHRTAVGPFDESIAVALDEVPEPLEQARLITLERAVAMVGAGARTDPSGQGD